MQNNNSFFRNLICVLILISFALSTTYGRTIKSEKPKQAKIKTVLVLGNSIVNHAPKPEFGWFGNWGMAASTRDSDYVHLLIRDIHSKDPSVVVRYASIADFERKFTTYPLSNLDSLRYPDMLILKISENVNDKMAKDSNFIFWYDKLVKYITPNPTAVIVIMDGFWVKDVNRSIKEYAFKNNYPFVPINQLYKDSTNTAKGKFAHEGVAAHLCPGRDIWEARGVSLLSGEHRAGCDEVRPGVLPLRADSKR